MRVNIGSYMALDTAPPVDSGSEQLTQASLPLVGIETCRDDSRFIWVSVGSERALVRFNDVVKAMNEVR